jgi:hypothetical protein
MSKHIQHSNSASVVSIVHIGESWVYLRIYSNQNRLIVVAVVRKVYPWYWPSTSDQ